MIVFAVVKSTFGSAQTPPMVGVGVAACVTTAAFIWAPAASTMSWLTGVPSGKFGTAA